MHWLVFAFDHWLFHPLVGRGYQFWSGIAGCFVSLSVLGGVGAIYRRHNCHVRWCWRLGKHAVSGTPYVVCTKHHPTVPDKGATIHEIQRARSRRDQRRD